MDCCRKSEYLSYQDEVLEGLFDAKTLVNVTKKCCLTREFNGDYYGIPKDYVPMISNERNEYISLLTLISDKLYNIGQLKIN